MTETNTSATDDRESPSRTDRLTATDFQRADGTADWRVLDEIASAWFHAPSHAAGAALIGRIVGQADPAGVPDVDVRATGVRVRIGAAGPPGLTRDDLRVARAVSASARDLGLRADPAALQTVQLTIDDADRSAMLSFWRTALGYQAVGAENLGDPLRRYPTVSFRHRDQARPLRNRIHVDVVRSPTAVQEIKTVLGQEAYGVYGLTLADADGNEVDLVPGDKLPDGPATADWEVLFGAMTFYRTHSPRQAAELVAAVAGLADEADLPVLVDLRPEGVTIDSGKDQWEGPFGELAGRIQASAHQMGLTADAEPLRFVQFGVDAVDVGRVRDFWTSVLGYQRDPRGGVTDIYDPRRLDPVIIFQDMDASDEDRRRQRNRTHFELVVPFDQVRARIDAAVAAGGRILAADTANRCTLADPEGNEVDVVSQP